MKEQNFYMFLKLRWYRLSWEFCNFRIQAFQVTKIYFSYIFGLHLWFLAYDTQNPWNVLAIQAMRAYLVIMLGPVKSITKGLWVNQLCQHNEASKKLKRRFKELPCQGTRMLLYATVPGPKLHRDRSSFVWNLALCISSSGCWLIALNILYNELVI